VWPIRKDLTSLQPLQKYLPVCVNDWQSAHYTSITVKISTCVFERLKRTSLYFNYCNFFFLCAWMMAMSALHLHYFKNFHLCVWTIKKDLTLLQLLQKKIPVFVNDWQWAHYISITVKKNTCVFDRLKRTSFYFNYCKVFSCVREWLTMSALHLHSCKSFHLCVRPIKKKLTLLQALIT